MTMEDQSAERRATQSSTAMPWHTVNMASVAGRLKAEKVLFSVTQESCHRALAHPIGSHIEIGWRLVRHAWGHGYATEAAVAALNDAFIRVGLAEVVAYTAPDNLRSQAVMTRVRMKRDPSRDFTADYGSIKAWLGLVWVARRAA
jgi:RimJ/RimL family protein N-acetyltransferase